MTLDDWLLPAHGVHDGARILECSPDLAEMFGYSNADEVSGCSLLEFIDPAMQDKTVRHVLAGEWGVYESVGKKKSGARFPVEISARPIRFGGKQARLILVRDLSPIALVVDDEAVVCKMTAALLERSGFRTLLAESAEAALEQFQPGKLALLMTDVSMPGVSGVELGKRIRLADPGLPIVYVSGYSPHEIPLDENSRYIAKPFGVAQLNELLRTLPARTLPGSEPCGFGPIE